MTSNDERIAALEAKIQRLEATLSASAIADAPDPVGSVMVDRPPAGLSRRRLLRSGGAVAVGAAGSLLATAHAAGAQSAATAWFDIRDYGAVANGSDSAPAITAAIAAAVAAGGGTVLVPPGRFSFGGPITIPDGVDIWGCGGHTQGANSKGSVLRALNASARIIVNSTGGLSGNLMVDGNNLVSPAAGLVYIDAVERQFTALRVCQSLTDGIVIERTQNCTFTQVMVTDCGRDGLVLDLGAGGNLFLRSEINKCNQNNIHLKSGASGPFGGKPSFNTFVRCTVERSLSGAATHPKLKVEGGEHNLFSHCGFSDSAYATNPNADTGVAVLTGGVTVFEHCDFYTTVTAAPDVHGIRVSNAGLYLYGRTVMTTKKGIDWGAGSSGGVFGYIHYNILTDPRWTGTNSGNVATRGQRPHEIDLDGGSVYAFRVKRNGENGFRFQVANDGEVQLNDGSGWTPKALWRLCPGGGWETPGLVRLNQSGLLVDQRTSAIGALETDQAMIYVKGDKLVVAYNDGATTHYKYLALNDASVAWVNSATAP